MVPDLIVLALDYYRAPLRFGHLADPDHPLPAGFDNLVTAVGGALSPHQLEATARVLGTSATELDRASRFFLRQVLLAPGSSHYRILGVSPGADEETIRQHYQLLVRFFHPDRSLDDPDRDALYTARINEAYRVLKDPGRRRGYDRQLAAKGRSPAAGEDPAAAGPAFRPRAPFADSAGRNGFRSRGPVPLILGGGIALALAAVLLVFLSAREPALRVNPELARSSAARPSYLSEPQAGPAGDPQRARSSGGEVAREPAAPGEEAGPASTGGELGARWVSREAIREEILRRGGAGLTIAETGTGGAASETDGASTALAPADLASPLQARAAGSMTSTGAGSPAPAGRDSGVATPSPGAAADKRVPANRPETVDGEPEAAPAALAERPVLIRPVDSGPAESHAAPPESGPAGPEVEPTPAPVPAAATGEARVAASKDDGAKPATAPPAEGARQPAKGVVAPAPESAAPKARRGEAAAREEDPGPRTEAPRPKPPPAEPARPTVRPDAVIGQLTRHYRDGNLDGFVGLFTADARVNEGNGPAVIRAAYGRLFAATSARRLYITGLGWRDVGNGTLVGAGAYSAGTKNSPISPWFYEKGSMSFELVPWKDRYKISKMIYR
jgi:curved DNA-binding protein CbpA